MTKTGFHELQPDKRVEHRVGDMAPKAQLINARTTVSGTASPDDNSRSIL
jgi:hypothetical protein